MKIVTTVTQVREIISEQRKSGQKIGFVPTMGALHGGHLSLVEACKKNGDFCVMSIFVNPAQFGPNEDFDTYPRPIEKDIKFARGAKVDLLFLPEIEEIYPTQTDFRVGDLQFNKVFCGPYRPVFFQGVCTVVDRLLQIVTSDRMYLGQKDAQQLRILQELVKQLSLPVEIIPAPTYREKSGLAMSSRNQYLSTEQKEKAAIIYHALMHAKKLFDTGERVTLNIVEASKKIMESEPSFQIQYVDIVQWSDFRHAPGITEKSVLAVAGFMGKTRLIDNALLEP